MGRLEDGIANGITFVGSGFIPDEVSISFEGVRSWAEEEGLIWDEEIQLITKQKIKSLAKYFPANFSFSILICVYEKEGQLGYIEYPFIPISFLLKLDKEVEIDFYKLCPHAWDAEGNALRYGEVHFVFFFPEVEEQSFYSISYSKYITWKFLELFEQIPDSYEKIKGQDGSLFVDLFCDLNAKFIKSGRAHDVELFFESNKDDGV
jgi:hypothetical protein